MKLRKILVLAVAFAMAAAAFPCTAMANSYGSPKVTVNIDGPKDYYEDGGRYFVVTCDYEGFENFTDYYSRHTGTGLTSICTYLKYNDTDFCYENGMANSGLPTSVVGTVEPSFAWAVANAGMVCSPSMEAYVTFIFSANNDSLTAADLDISVRTIEFGVKKAVQNLADVVEYYGNSSASTAGVEVVLPDAGHMAAPYGEPELTATVNYPVEIDGDVFLTVTVGYSGFTGFVNYNKARNRGVGLTNASVTLGFDDTKLDYVVTLDGVFIDGMGGVYVPSMTYAWPDAGMKNQPDADEFMVAYFMVRDEVDIAEANLEFTFDSYEFGVTDVNSGTVYYGTTSRSTSGMNADAVSFCVSQPVVESVRTPAASVQGGTVTSGTAVALSTETIGADIYYTTDGSTPTSSSTKYTGAVTITQDVTIKAIAVKHGMNNSSVASFIYTVLSSDNTSITVSDSRARAGDTVSVTVDLDNKTNIAGMILKLSYDDGLTLTSFETGTGLNSLTFTPPQYLSLNPCNLLWDGIDGDTASGIILTLEFKVSDNAAEGDYNISLSYNKGDIYDDNLDDVNVDITNGKVTVVNYRLGDVNDDGDINAKDITLLRRYVSGSYGVTITEAAADVNNDGSINAKDITLLRRYVSGSYGITFE